MTTFHLELLTPKKQFFSGEVETLICKGLDGEIGVLASHQPMTAALDSGEMRIKTADGTWKSAFVSDGILEVNRDGAVIFSHLCAWPDEIDEARAKAEIEKEREKLRNAASLSEHRKNEIQLQRMLAMLSFSTKNSGNIK